MFLKEVSYAHQDFNYFVRYTVKTVIVCNITTIYRRTIDAQLLIMVFIIINAEKSFFYMETVILFQDSLMSRNFNELFI